MSQAWPKDMQSLPESLLAWLHEMGMPSVPARLSAAACHQEIAAETLAGIDAFIEVFERVTSRPAWAKAVSTSHQSAEG